MNVRTDIFFFLPANTSDYKNCAFVKHKVAVIIYIIHTVYKKKKYTSRSMVTFSTLLAGSCATVLKKYQKIQYWHINIVSKMRSGEYFL
jgi:hypothetical protein